MLTDEIYLSCDLKAKRLFIKYLLFVQFLNLNFNQGIRPMGTTYLQKASYYAYMYEDINS
jgi:hypothetical protein